MFDAMDFAPCPFCGARWEKFELSNIRDRYKGLSYAAKIRCPCGASMSAERYELLEENPNRRGDIPGAIDLLRESWNRRADRSNASRSLSPEGEAGDSK